MSVYCNKIMNFFYRVCMLYAISMGSESMSKSTSSRIYHIPSFTLKNQEHPHVETSGLVPNGQEEARECEVRYFTNAKYDGERLTITKCYQAKGRSAVNSRVNAVQLCVYKPLELWVPRGSLAVRRRGDDAVDVEGITRVLSVSDRVCNQCIRVGHTG